MRAKIHCRILPLSSLSVSHIVTKPKGDSSSSAATHAAASR